MKILLLLFLFVFINASNIINVTYFTLNNKIDILFSFDTPFKGKIKYISPNDYEITQVSFNRMEHKKIKNLDILITPIDENSIEIKFKYNKKLKINASITAKGYGLRIRVLGLENKININNSNEDFNSLNQNNNVNFNIVNYLIVIAILIFLIIILFYVKKKTLQKLPKSLQQDNYKVLYQKMIDPKNKIVMIEIFNKKYLLLFGEKNTILLDRFSEEMQSELKNVKDENDFKQLFDERIDETKAFIEKASQLKENNEF